MSNSEVTLTAIGLGNRMATVIANLCRAEPRVRVLGYCDPSPSGLPLLEGAGLLPGTRFGESEAMLELVPLYAEVAQHLWLVKWRVI